MPIRACDIPNSSVRKKYEQFGDFEELKESQHVKLPEAKRSVLQQKDNLPNLNEVPFSQLSGRKQEKKANSNVTNKGEDALQRSSELIHSGNVIKTSKGGSQDRVMFLFDHQLVYCKKEILKKNGLTYKRRIDMDDFTEIWLRDGELIPFLFLETLNRSPLNNAWKIYNFKKEKWYIFHTKKAAQRENLDESI
ncbi:unnamed protein product [Porites lobata]|uniref:SOS1/NGEF-like PH domain-containing protein n=1 Tax=Porites lobata TaxID=104759 RepID=A0ABN8RF48_9CNID|nr:unnamed protein product [Porites lobata]